VSVGPSRPAVVPTGSEGTPPSRVRSAAGEPGPVEDDPVITPPDPTDPLKRDHEDDDEGHPGADPVVDPLPEDRSPGAAPSFVA
jgi:hypothetical protein